MARKPHVIVTAFPAQGHVAPLMKLAYKLADHGIKVTFVNTEFIHSKIKVTMPEEVEEHNGVRLVSVPDGLELVQDRKNLYKMTESMMKVFPGHLQNLIEKINQQSSDDGKITCLIADPTVGWVLEVAKKLGIKGATCSPIGLENLAFLLHVPKLLEDGVIKVDGTPVKDELIFLSNEFPAWSVDEYPWSIRNDANLRKFTFESFCLKFNEILSTSDWVLTNSFYELEPSAYHMLPPNFSIGPLLQSPHWGHFAGNFWPEDQTCLTWLDQQPANSVIYVAFGSVAIFNKQQFEELAFGLELTNRPFLWVVRSDLTDGTRAEFPDGFLERVADRGKIVEWASQEKVLSHSSTACFFSHCGWNSTIEGLSMGAPFLCWPAFGEHFHYKRYICETWKNGLEVRPDENGIITREEIVKKISMLLSNDAIKANALKLKEMARKSISEGGSSVKNFERFVELLKA